MDSKMKMVKGKDGKMVPSFAADGVGRMKKGGMMGENETKKTPEKKGFFESAKDTLKEGARQVADDIHYMTGTERGKNIEKSLNEKYPYRTEGMKTGGMMKSKMKASGGVHKMPDDKTMKNSAMKTMKKARG